MIRRILTAALLLAPSLAFGEVPSPLIYPATPSPTIAAGATWNSGALLCSGRGEIIVAATSTQPGQIEIDRYFDPAGNVTFDTHTANMSAGQPASLALADNVVCGSFVAKITNTGASSATLTNALVAIEPH